MQCWLEDRSEPLPELISPAFHLDLRKNNLAQLAGVRSYIHPRARRARFLTRQISGILRACKLSLDTRLRPEAPMQCLLGMDSLAIRCTILQCFSGRRLHGGAGLLPVAVHAGASATDSCSHAGRQILAPQGICRELLVTDNACMDGSAGTDARLLLRCVQSGSTASAAAQGSWTLRQLWHIHGP